MTVVFYINVFKGKFQLHNDVGRTKIIWIDSPRYWQATWQNGLQCREYEATLVGNKVKNNDFRHDGCKITVNNV